MEEMRKDRMTDATHRRRKLWTVTDMSKVVSLTRWIAAVVSITHLQTLASSLEMYRYRVGLQKVAT